MNNEIVIYTVITGNYDNLSEVPEFYFPDVYDYICLTDNPNTKSKNWKIIKIDLIDNDCQLTQRFYKIIINKYIKKYKKSIYIDGKIKLNNNIFKELDNLNSYDMVGFEHYKRKCLYQEGAVLLHPYKQICTKEKIIPLIQYIKENNFPKMFGLTDTCCLIRNHNDLIIKMMDQWFNLLKKYSRRDQLSFMYCVWKNNLNIFILPDKKHKEYFKIKPHNQLKNKIIDRKKWMIGFDPYENRKYYFNINNRLCKWDLNSNYEEEHYKFLELGYDKNKYY
jgi:hypothetical protein